MRFTRHLSILLTAVLCVCPADALAAVPTPAHLRQTFDAGDYRGTLAGISRALALAPGADEGYDRYELLMLKGECLVQLDSGALAADAFEDAREVTKDVKLAATAKANELLLRRALAFKYVPKTGAERAPIDVKPAAGRPRAMMALRADLLGQHKSKLEVAARADNLEPLLTLMPVLREVAVLELGATGELAQSRPMLVELGTHARSLITAEVKRCHQE